MIYLTQPFLPSGLGLSNNLTTPAKRNGSDGHLKKVAAKILPMPGLQLRARSVTNWLRGCVAEKSAKSF